jgi:NDP-sugar pyrophosphorylase family protein
MSYMLNIDAIILCGGSAKRMKHFLPISKALAEIRPGQILLCYQINWLTQTNVKSITLATEKDTHKNVLEKTPRILEQVQCSVEYEKLGKWSHIISKNNLSIWCRARYSLTREIIEQHFPDRGNFEDPILPQMASNKQLQYPNLDGEWITINNIKRLDQTKQRLTEINTTNNFLSSNKIWTDRQTFFLVSP